MKFKKSIWEYPAAKSRIENAIKRCVKEYEKRDINYILNRIGYYLYTGEEVQERVSDFFPKIKETIDIIRQQDAPISIVKEIFEYVAFSLTLSSNIRTTNVNNFISCLGQYQKSQETEKEKFDEEKIRKAVNEYYERNDLIRKNPERNEVIADIIIAIAKHEKISLARFEYYSEHIKKFLSYSTISF